MESKTATDLAHVTLGEGETKVEKTVPAGSTLVSVLKTELGVDAASVLWLIKGKERTVLADDTTIDVRSGMHFEAISGGGVS